MIEEYCKCKYSISPKVRLRMSFVISYLSYKAKAFDKSFKGGKMCIVNIAKVLLVVKTLIKKYYSFDFLLIFLIK